MGVETDNQLKILKDTESFTKKFSKNKDWKNLSALSKKIFINQLSYNFNHSLAGWSTSEFDESRLEDLNDEYINIPLDNMIEDCLNYCMTDNDGFGYWHFIQKSTGKHFTGVDDNFSCDYIINIFGAYDIYENADEKEKKFLKENIKKYLKDNLEEFDFELVGVMWYNK